MKAILAADQRWGIGREGKLLANIPDDLKYFRRMTTGAVVVMGRKTLESLPGGRPLPKRINIVLTRNLEFAAEGAIVVHDIPELLQVLKSGVKDADGKPVEEPEVFVIGGGEIYRALLPYCTIVYVTRLERTFEADTYFPDLDESEEFALTAKSDRKEHEGLGYCFCEYTRRDV
jgi:dihydrofolate reductase